MEQLYNNNMTKTLHCERVECELVGADGNAFSLLGHWQRCARKANRTKEEIKAVMDDAMGGDYNHLLCVLSDHCV